MWWAVDEDWVEDTPAPQAQSAKRHLERKSGKKGKRGCKARGEIGYVHAADPSSGNATISDIASTSTLSSIDGSTASQSESATSASLTAISASDSASASSTSSSTIPKPVQSGTSDAEGEQDGIQLKVGRSLVQVAKEGFERYAQGLDTTWNVLEYPSSGESSSEHVVQR